MWRYNLCIDFFVAHQFQYRIQKTYRNFGDSITKKIAEERDQQFYPYSLISVAFLMTLLCSNKCLSDGDNDDKDEEGLKS